ncbi:MAG: hypothetical protein HY332_01470 [Chloroflexi bacterium]|nr:hypothetical protein [Chloroflexota bacterium]
MREPTRVTPQTPETVVCNGCLILIDPGWEPVTRIGEFSFHRHCAPICSVCGGSLARVANGHAAECIVLDSQVEFMSARGYQVRLKACCCRECYESALHDDPPALA